MVVCKYRNQKKRNRVLEIENRTESNRIWKIQTNPALILTDHAECEGVTLHTWCGQLLHTQRGLSVCWWATNGHRLCMHNTLCHSVSDQYYVIDAWLLTYISTKSRRSRPKCQDIFCRQWDVKVRGWDEIETFNNLFEVRLRRDVSMSRARHWERDYKYKLVIKAVCARCMC